MMILNSLTTSCSDFALARTLTFVHKIFAIFCVLVPITLIVFAVIELIKLVFNPDEKKAEAKIIKKFVAALLVFFLPSFTNLVMAFIHDTKIEGSEALLFDVAECWNIADKISAEVGDATYQTSTEKTNGSFMGDLSGLRNYINRKGGVGTTLEGGMPIPLYYQDDYSDVYLYPGRTLTTSGCGFVSGAMVASYLLDKEITPRDVVDDWSKAYYVLGQGMSWGFPKALAEHYHLGSVKETTSASEVVEALRENRPVITSQDPGIFTRGGHILVLRGLNENGKILVNDPNKNNAVGKDFNHRAFDISEIDASAANYWIFEAKGK